MQCQHAGTRGTHPRDAQEEMLEPEAKKLRRKLNNRESARRSRQKKADEISRLQELVSLRDAELEQSRQAVAMLQMHVQLLTAKVSELGGSNVPIDAQVLCNAATESQPAADTPAVGAQMPPEAQTAVNVLGGIEQPGPS